jgi:hypothetical protein
MHVTVYGPLFFMETTITGIVYLDILQQFLIPQLDEDDQGHIHFQQDGAPVRYLVEVLEYLSTRFPGRCNGQAAPIAWPPRSPDLTPFDCFLWGFVTDLVSVPPLRANIAGPRTRITAPVI